MGENTTENSKKEEETRGKTTEDSKNLDETKEKTTDDSKGEKKGQYTCKYCGDVFGSVPDLGAHSKKCEEAIKARAEKAEKKTTKKKEKRISERKVEPETKEERPTLFKKPKTPTEILRGICEDHQLDDRFIDLIVGRSEKIGGIHPIDFRKMLVELKSGIGTKAEADYIADDYYYALQQSQQRAQESGYRMSYPLDVYRGGEREDYGYGRPVDEPIHGEPRRHERGGYLPPRERGYETSSGYRKAFGGPELTREEVMKIMSDALEKKRREDKIDELNRKMEAREEKRDDEMKKLMEEIREIKSTPSAPTTPPDNVTKEDLMHMFEKKDASETIKAQEERLKMEKEIRLAERKAQDEKHKDLLQDIRTLKDEIRNRPAKVSTEGYSKDEVRLLADTIQTVAPGRYPLRDGLKIVFSPVGGEKERPKREKIEGGEETSIFDSLPADMISEE